MAKTTFIACGDAFATRRLPKDGYEGFAEIQACVKKHDVAFLNLESTFHDREGAPAAVSGGTWAMSDPRTLDDIASYGFNLYNTANNHSGDYSHGGILATIRNLKERDMLFSGTGKDLGDASKPCYLEAPGCRVALISVCSTSDKSHMAGAQSADMPGRPGLNPLKYSRIYHLDPEHYAMAQELAKVTKINAAQERSARNGYANPPKEGTMAFGPTRFVLDETCRIVSTPDEKDMNRIEGEIREAKLQADVVLVSFHGHETDAADNTVPAQFLETFSRRCIDAGANVVIGHGPHEIRGIEQYKDGLIFYSLGNFIFETETVEYQPADAYINKSMPLDTKVGAYMTARSQNGTAGYGILPEIWFSVMAGWTMEDGKLTEAKLYPIDLGQHKPRSQKGVPVLSGSEEVLKYMAKLSAPYGTEIDIADGVGTIRLK